MGRWRYRVEEGIIQGREVRRVANKYLQSKGLPLIKSRETVRSWSKPRNKRSSQAMQHRGEGLWKQDGLKRNCQMCMWISTTTGLTLTITPAWYLRMTPHTASLLWEEPWMTKPIWVAGPLKASVGQSIYTPFQISSENLQFKLPSSDYPQDSGSVLPGVILLVNNMKEVPYNGQYR